MDIEIQGLHLNYEESVKDSAMTALIIHGWGANFPAVKPIFQLLKHHMHVVALELPGHGQSEEPSTVFGTKEFADVVEAFIQKKNLTNVLYIGHSFGGKIGILLGQKKDLIDAMVLMDASGIREPLSKEAQRRIKRFKRRKKWMDFFLGEKGLEKIYRKYGSSDYSAAKGIMRSILVKVVNEDFSSHLSHIDMPVQLIWGDKDTDTPLWMGEKMHHEIPHSNLAVLEGGHYVYLDNFVEFKKVLLAFIEEVNNGFYTI
ncbi:MAG: alpha/beta hydrolase [Tissierellia bacterium]|nr:alpha/beta hydrolase [Tissierellia bacterium]